MYDAFYLLPVRVATRKRVARPRTTSTGDGGTDADDDFSGDDVSDGTGNLCDISWLTAEASLADWYFSHAGGPEV